jgi:hypothetical protein
MFKDHIIAAAATEAQRDMMRMRIYGMSNILRVLGENSASVLDTGKMQ